MIKTVIYQNKSLAYHIDGNGQPVVLLHGFGGDPRSWEHQTNFLKQKFQIIRPYLPGTGNSQLVDDMSMEGMADCIHHILQQENINTCTMIGHSMGGYITLAFVEKYASRLTSFGLFHSAAFPDSEEKKANRQKGIQTIKEHGASYFLNTLVPNLYSSHTKTHNPSIIEEHLKRTADYSAESLIAYYEAMIKRPDRIAVLKQNKIPVLFVLGKEDSVIPINDGLQQVHQPNLSYIHILELSGHMGMKEEPEKSNEIINNFLLKTI